MKEVKLGDMVIYKCSNTGKSISGIVTDIFGEYSSFEGLGWPMYEVVSVDPSDRIWLSEYEMSVIGSIKKTEKGEQSA